MGYGKGRVGGRAADAMTSVKPLLFRPLLFRSSAVQLPSPIPQLKDLYDSIRGDAIIPLCSVACPERQRVE